MDEITDIPGYKIEKRLGHGGMATVHLAIQESFGRHVALKVMSDSLSYDKVWAKRFIQEAQVVAQLSHPNIVPVFDVGQHEGRFFISMELLGGGSLKERMEKGLSVAACLKIIVGVAAGLDFAGEKGFVHRDIKPDNIMFREDGSPVILDFGIVKQKNAAGSHMTQTGMIVGTTAYMSPEQAQAKELDERSDIYSLGIVFYEMLTGTTPFRGESDIATLLCHVNEPPPPLPHYLHELQPVMDKALAKTADERYSRAREMIEDLERLEPEIKVMLSNLESMSGETDATVVMRRTTDDKTQTIATPIRSTVTAALPGEDDLTKVLNSAKATIKDHSAESRNRKARRSRNFLVASSVLASLALVYVGYQQLYVVPKERALAEQRIEDAKLKTQKKIESILEEAKNANLKIDLANVKQADVVVALYREVLKLDPENIQATIALESYANQYYKLAQKAIEEKDLGNAEVYRDYLVELMPSHPMLPELRGQIQAFRSEHIQAQLDTRLKQERIDTLLEYAGRDIQESGFTDTAFTQVEQVLKLDANNALANQYKASMQKSLEQKAELSISSGRFGEARGYLEDLERYYADSSQIKKLKSSLKSATGKANKKNRVSQLLTTASQLKREKQTIQINDELRKTYRNILALQSNNREAKNGMKETSLFDLEIADQAIADHDFYRAKQQINVVEKFTPKLSELASIKKKYSRAIDANSKALSLLKDADKLISNRLQGDVRKNLKNAMEKIKQAQEADPGNPKIEKSLLSLENGYVQAMNQSISDKNKSLTDSYINDTAGITWPSDRILKIKLAQESASKPKTKPKRAITGGF